jgi:biotin transport system substrate-specific component
MQGESGGRMSINPRAVQRPIYYMVLTALFAALTAVGAFIKIPFYPVPLTLQTFFTMLAAMTLPPLWAAVSQLLYLGVGLIGLPVFANGGGLAYVMQPTFGYLVLLPLLAFFTATILKSPRSDLYVFLIIFSAQLVHLFGGAVWLLVNLSLMAGSSISFAKALMIGTIIFLPASVVKTLALVWMKRKLDAFFSLNQ